MRLVTWDEFQALPVGTVFQEYYAANHELGELAILGGADPSYRDFTSASLLPQCIAGCNLESDHPLRAVSEIITMPSGHGRDGMYDQKGRTWLVWEDADRTRLARWLLEPDKGVAEQNDDDIMMVVLEA